MVFFTLSALVAMKCRYTSSSVQGPTTPSSCDTEKSSPRFSSPLSLQAAGSGLEFRSTSFLLSLLQGHEDAQHRRLGEHHDWRLLGAAPGVGPVGCLPYMTSLRGEIWGLWSSQPPRDVPASEEW